MAVVSGHAIVAEGGDAYSVSLADGTQTPLTSSVLGGLVADNAAVYAENSSLMVNDFFRITPVQATGFGVMAPPGFSASRFFAEADGFLYFPVDCSTPEATPILGFEINSCPRSGIFRVPSSGGLLDPVVTVGASVDTIAARGSDLYFTVVNDADADAIYHADVGSFAPPVFIQHAAVPLMGLTAVDGGVLAPTPGAVLFIARDGSRTKTVLTTDSPCGRPTWQGDLVACASAADGKVYVAHFP